uniref:Uncharacterized protein n=1 Tax=Sphaerodactylus townsendi TaxID=933632 RepID=A0ACB8F7Z7_9SAUR
MPLQASSSVPSKSGSKPAIAKPPKPKPKKSSAKAAVGPEASSMDSEEAEPSHALVMELAAALDNNANGWCDVGTAPLAGNVSLPGRQSEGADLSEAEAWWMLQVSEEAWDSEREEYHRALCHMERVMEHL